MSVVLITGCNSGFGKLTALEFARRGDEVYATMRDTTKADELLELAESDGLTIQVLQLDVNDQESINKAVKTIVQQKGRIDVLINNAGIAIAGAFEDMPEQDIRKIFETNFFGPINLTRAVLPVMREQKAGEIIMLSSLSALVGLPGDAAYAASKAALERASESLYYEVQRFGINVSVVEPGAFNTDMPNKMAGVVSEKHDSPYQLLHEFNQRKIKESINKGDDPQLVASAVVNIVCSAVKQFCHPVGKQAQQVVAQIKAQSEEEREDMIKQISGIDWWIAGKDAP